QSLAGLSTWIRAKKGLRMLQSRNNFFPSLTVEESLKLAKVANVPEEIRPLIGKKMSSLSGGELQRVVGSGALDGAKLSAALLDEPFAALDPAGVKEMTNRIRTALQFAEVLIAVPSIHF